MGTIQKLSSVAASIIVLSGAVAAQDSETRQGLSDGWIEEVVVTATRRETGLQETPIALTALGSQALEQRNAEDLQDVAKYTPGLQIIGLAGRGGGAGSNVSIRGIGTDAQESQASVGTYIDEVYFPSGFGNVLGLLDVERVEVLRGPQGTLFGRNTIAGAIQYVSVAPENEFSSYLKGTFGNFDRKGGEGAMTLPIHEQFNVRLAAMYEDQDGYVYDQLNDIDRGAEEVKAGRIRARWEPSDHLTVNLKTELIRVETNGRTNVIGAVNPFAQFAFLAANPGVWLPPPLNMLIPPEDLTGFDDTLISPLGDPSDFTLRGLNYPDFLDFEYDVYQGAIEWDLSDKLTLKSITAQVESEAVFSQDFDLTPYNILATETIGDLEAFSQELQLSGTAFSDSLSFVTGLYYYDSSDTGSASSLVGIGNLLPPGGVRAGIDTESIAVYGQGTLDLTDAFSLSLGIRYTDEKVTSSLEDIARSDLDFKYDDWSPHIGVQYQAGEDVMLYAKASKGFRAGGNTASTDLPNFGLSFDPEEAWTYEIGARTTFGGVFRFNPTLFLTDWSDAQSVIIVFTPAPVATTQNIGETEIYGLELETEWAASEALTLFLSAALMEGKYKKLYPNIVASGGLTTDADLPALPKFKFTIGGNYGHRLDNGMRLDFSLDYSWIDKHRSFLQEHGAITLDSYGLLGARAQLDITEFVSLALYGNNLTDEVYFLGGTDFANGGTVGIQELNVGRGRAYGAELKFSF